MNCFKISVLQFSVYFLIMMLLSCCIACNKSLEDLSPLINNVLDRKSEQDLSYRLYIIEKDQHASAHTLEVITGDSLEFIAMFDSSAIYVTKKAANQQDVNKLYGFSSCGTHHQENSVRLGWNWYQGALHIYAYVYRNKQRVIQKLTTVNLYEKNKYGIYLKEGNYIFTINGRQYTTIQTACQGKAVGYKLFPYFGGDEKAPHPIHIQIKDL